MAQQPPQQTISAALEVTQPIPAVKDNETIAWDFLTSHGFTRNQTAGIMGNLRQEHSFNTSDVPGGLGIAQWIGSRRDILLGRPNYTDINVQLEYLLEELNGVESVAKAAILAANTVEGSAVAFSSLFERCGICMDDKRISYAYEIMGRH